MHFARGPFEIGALLNIKMVEVWELGPLDNWITGFLDK
jgi:hypothetical protein